MDLLLGVYGNYERNSLLNFNPQCNAGGVLLYGRHPSRPPFIIHFLWARVVFEKKVLKLFYKNIIYIINIITFVVTIIISTISPSKIKKMTNLFFLLQELYLPTS